MLAVEYYLSQHEDKESSKIDLSKDFVVSNNSMNFHFFERDKPLDDEERELIEAIESENYEPGEGNRNTRLPTITAMIGKIV